MKVAVSSMGSDLDAEASPKFGRCPRFLIVDSESLQFEAIENPAMNAPGGAGIQAAQTVVGTHVRAVITGEVGPKAAQVLQAAALPVYLFRGGTARRAVEDFKAGKLEMAFGESVTGDKPPQPTTSNTPQSRQEEIAALEGELSQLRVQMASLLERIDRLQEVR
jgi:predicted Fe-Mo cluster-binding NifX family protein